MDSKIDLVRHFAADWRYLRDYLTDKGAQRLPPSGPARPLTILSPPGIRIEHTPSFTLRWLPAKAAWGWRDWSDGSHGTLIDLVIRHEGAAGCGAALRWLCLRFGSPGEAVPHPPSSANRPPPSSSPHPLPASAPADEGGFVLRWANERPVKMALNQEYLARRGLSERVYGYLHDVCWSPSDNLNRRYYGVGLPNLRGDWNVRAGMTDKRRSRLYVRSTTNPSTGVESSGGPLTGAESWALTRLKAGAARVYDVVEGALSGMALIDSGVASGALLILNGVGNAGAAAELLTRTATLHPDVVIRLHLDGDAAGAAAAARIVEAVPAAQNMQPLYAALGEEAGDEVDPLDAWNRLGGGFAGRVDSFR